MRSGLLAVVLFGLVVAAPTTALAQPAGGGSGDQVVLSGDVLVPQGQVVDEVVVFSGSARIEGVAQGDVVVLDGPVTIAGQVGGDVVALHGQVRLLASAQVTGDVLAGGGVTVADGAHVGGTVRHGVRFTMAGPVEVLGGLVASIAIAVSVLLVLLLMLLFAPRGLDRSAEAGHGAPATVALWGAVVCVAIPVTGLVAAATVLGLPLALAILLAIGLCWLLGLATASFALGRLFVRSPGSRVGALFAGWGVTAVVGLVPFLNVAWWVLASVVGIGAMVVATWRARSGVARVPGGRGGRHRRSARSSTPSAPTVEPTEGERPSEMPLAED